MTHSRAGEVRKLNCKLAKLRVRIEKSLLTHYFYAPTIRVSF